MSAAPRILHLEDSAEDAELIECLLRREWPDVAIDRVANESGFVAALERGGHDVILSDYSVPHFDGMNALQLARRHCPEVPFIFLSGTIGEESAVAALKAGAYDYVIKDRLARLVPSIRRAGEERLR